jgi:TPR repeat protein
MKKYLIAVAVLSFSISLFAADKYEKLAQEASKYGRRVIAMEYTKKSMDSGNKESAVTYGMQMVNEESPADQKEGLKILLKFAGEGNARAQNALAYAFQTGKGAKKDSVKALEWYKKSAAQDYEPAYNGIGSIYEEGIAVTKDLKTAIEYYKKASEKGDSMGMNNLGYMYLSGNGVPVDTKKGLEWMTKAAEKGNMLAINNLVSVYQGKLGVKRDNKLLLKWLERAALNGDNDALTAIVEYYRGEKPGTKKDCGKAMSLLKQAAEQGRLTAALDYGFALEHGKCCKVDLVEACAWYWVVYPSLPESQHKLFMKEMADTEKNMTKDQIEEAKKRADKLLKKFNTE